MGRRPGECLESHARLCAGSGERGVTMILGLSHFTDCATLNMHYRVDTPQARSFLGQYLDLPGGSAAVR